MWKVAVRRATAFIATALLDTWLKGLHACVYALGWGVASDHRPMGPYLTICEFGQGDQPRRPTRPTDHAAWIKSLYQACVPRVDAGTDHPAWAWAVAWILHLLHGEGKMGQCAFVCKAPALAGDAPCMHASACPAAFCGSLRPGMLPHAPMHPCAMRGVPAHVHAACARGHPGAGPCFHCM
jgi:hypothetical protein